MLGKDFSTKSLSSLLSLTRRLFTFYFETESLFPLPPHRVSLCNIPGCPETYFVVQAGFELTAIHMPLSPPKCWD